MEIRDVKMSGPSCEVNRSNSNPRQNRPRLERKGSSSKTRIATLAIVGAGLRSVSASPIGRTDEVGFASGNSRLPWTPEDSFAGQQYFHGKRNVADSVDWSNPANYAGVDWNDPKNYAGVNFNDPKLYLPATSASSSVAPCETPAAPAPVPEALETWTTSAQTPAQTQALAQQAQTMHTAFGHVLQNDDFGKEDLTTSRPATTATFVGNIASMETPSSATIVAPSTGAPAAVTTSTTVLGNVALINPTSTAPVAPDRTETPSKVATTLLTSTAPATTLQKPSTTPQGPTQTLASTPTALSPTGAFAGIAASQNAILVVNAGSTTATFSFWENYSAYQPNFDSAFASVQLAAGAQRAVSLPAAWSGRVQKMTGAVSDPATWGEVTFDGGYGNTYVDVSYIRGYNAPLQITDESNDLTEGSLIDLRAGAPASLKAVDSGGTSILAATEGFDGSVRQDVINYERASNVGASAYVINSDNQATRGVASKHLIFTFG